MDNIFKLIFFIIKNIFKGIKKCWQLKTKPALYIGLSITTTIMIVGHIQTNYKWGIAMTVFPYLVFLFIIGTSDREAESNNNDYEIVNSYDTADEEPAQNYHNPGSMYPVYVERKTETTVYMYDKNIDRGKYNG